MIRRRFYKQEKEMFDRNNYLTFEALRDNFTFTFSQELEYNVNGNGWSTLDANKISPPIMTGDFISLRANLLPIAGEGIGTFDINDDCNLSGNCMSLIFKDKAKNNRSLVGYDYVFHSLFDNCRWIDNVSDDFLPATKLGPYCYQYMFRNCTGLRSVPKLPATVLTEGCYESMFSGCKYLTSAPELPATTLAKDCYSNMFRNCTKLVTVPALPATTLVNGCYDEMFYYCSKLNYIKMFATDISTEQCLDNWVYAVSSTGTFVKNSAMTSLPMGVDGVPSGWTVINDGELLSFTVSNVKFSADIDMTWEQWVNSEYNVNSYYISGDGVYGSFGSAIYSDNGSTLVHKSDIILPHYNYQAYSGGSGD